MEFKDIVAITGKGGLFKLDTQKPNGCIVTSLVDGKTNFVSNRNHLFTLLDNIAIYTDADSEELINIFIKMREQREEIPIISAKSSSEELKGYLENILPDYDRDRVYVSDIKKMLKWFEILDAKGIIENASEKQKEEDSKEEQEEGPAETSTEDN